MDTVDLLATADRHDEEAGYSRSGLLARVARERMRMTCRALRPIKPTAEKLGTHEAFLERVKQPTLLIG